MSDFFNVSLEDILNGAVEVEKAKFGARLNTAASQPTDYNQATQSQNTNATQQAGKTSGVSTKTLIIGGGVVAVAAVIFMVMK